MDSRDEPVGGRGAVGVIIIGICYRRGGGMILLRMLCMVCLRDIWWAWAWLSVSDFIIFAISEENNLCWTYCAAAGPEGYVCRRGGTGEARDAGVVVAARCACARFVGYFHHFIGDYSLSENAPQCKLAQANSGAVVCNKLERKIWTCPPQKKKKKK